MKEFFHTWGPETLAVVIVAIMGWGMWEHSKVMNEKQARQQAWFDEHNCKRIGYDEGSSIFRCDDDNVYRFQHLPEKR